MNRWQDSWSRGPLWIKVAVVAVAIWSSPVVAQQRTSVFTYYGVVYLPSGAILADAGYQVRITTKALGHLIDSPVGANEPGKYAATIVDASGVGAAIEGDSVQLELRDPLGIPVSEPVQLELTAADIAAARLRTDISVFRVAFMLRAPVPRPLPEGTSTLVFQLANFGNFSDSYDLSISTEHPEWLVAPPSTAGPVAPDSSANVAIAVDVPPGQEFLDTVTLEACSRAQPPLCQRASTSTRNLPVDVSPSPGVALTLHQNQPNPFNPVTHVPFELSRTDRVDLSILDARGAVVRTLIGGELLREGYHVKTWNGLDDAGRPAASGVYYCRLQSSMGTRTRRMVLIR